MAPEYHFRPRFPVLHEHIEADRGHKAGLAVLARHFNIASRNRRSPSLARFQPNSVERMNFCHGSSFRVMRLRAHSPLTWGIISSNLITRSAAARSKKYGAPSTPSHLQIVELALAGEDHPLARQNPPGDNIAGVLKRGFNVGICRFLCHDVSYKAAKPFFSPVFFFALTRVRLLGDMPNSVKYLCISSSDLLAIPTRGSG